MRSRPRHPRASGMWKRPGKMSDRRPGRRWRRWLRGVAIAVLLMVGVLVAARLALPGYLASYVNGVLDRSPEYDGRIGEVDVHLWRGSYSVNEVKIVKTTNAAPVPFFEAERIDLTVDWPSLLRGRFRGKIDLIKPKINFVDGETAEESQTGADQPWLAMIDDLFPFRIDKARVIDGQVHLHAFYKSPQVDVYLSDVQGELRNLTNVEDSLDPLVATLHATGKAMGSGSLEFDMTLDPHAHRPSFSLAMRLLGVDVRRLNALAMAYGDFDFEQGEFDLVVEATAKEGFLDGYAKPLFRNVQVISLRDVKEKDPLSALWQALVGTVGELLTNQQRDQFGTRFAIVGDLDNPRTDFFEIVGNILRNAFIQAYLPRVEGRAAPEVARSREEGTLSPTRAVRKAAREESKDTPTPSTRR